MDQLTFTSEVVKSLAWPVATCVIVFALRHHVSALVKRLSSLKHNDTELTFAEDIDRAKEALEAKASPVQKAASSSKMSETENRILRLIEVSPAAGLVEAWTLLESAIRKKAAEFGYQPKDARDFSLQKGLAAIRDGGKITEDDAALVIKMRMWRNWSIHDNERMKLDASTAWKYASIAVQLLNEFDE